jgi:diguanylate cyclase (GGDEF)-like protein
MGKLAAIFYVGSGLLVAATVPIPGPSDVNRPASLAIALCAVAIGIAAWYVPWDRWPGWATIALAPAALVLIGAGNVYGGTQPYTYGIFFLVVFVWVGIALPRGTSLWLAAPAAVAYIGPIVALPGDHATGIASAALTIPVSVMIGETLAWVTGRVRQTADALDAKSLSLGLMQDIAVAANEAPDVEGAMKTCLDRICAHTGWPVGHVFLLDEGPAGNIVPSGIWHLEEGNERAWETFCQVTEATRIGPGVGLPGRVVASGRPEWVTDLAVEPSFLNGELAAELGVRATFAFPVLIGHEVVAVLEFFSDHPAEPDGELLDVMRHVGTQLGRVVERKRSADAIRAEEIAHRALHDSLTGLPNLTLFADRLGSALARLRRRSSTVAVMFLDLDHFKQVNDTLGHAEANRLLVEAVHRIESVVRPSDTVARFGGDEFLVLCDDLPGKAEALQIAGRITETFAQPFQLAGREVVVTTSVGIALATRPTESPDELISNADRAMYRAKRRGRDRYEVFDERMRAQARGKDRVESALRGALDRDELMLYFQPVVRVADGGVVSAEALLRWRHPDRGILAAAQFLPVAEESGLITAFDAWALHEACRWAAEWAGGRAFGDPFTISLNLSARQFARPEVAASVAQSLDEAGVDPASICLEVTESVLVEDPPTAIARMRALKETGVQLAIDDFGSGYASMGFVKRLPVDVLKLDGSLISALGRSEEDAAIVSAVITMAEGLDLRTVGKGVERPDQLEALRGLGCEWAQGTLWARPQPPQAVPKMLVRPVLQGA